MSSRVVTVQELVVARIEQALAACEAQGLWTAAERPAVQLERPRQAEHGDLATNVAMNLARAAKKNPRAVAEAVVAALGASPADPLLASAEVAGPGFINLRIAPRAWYAQLAHTYARGDRMGHSEALAGQRIIVEFVSANPTGPMHVGHGRGAVVGDVISRLLAAAGAQVHREYYINDAGGQVVHLAHAVWVRMTQLLAASHPGQVHAQELGPDDYKGEYVTDLARTMLSTLPEAEQLALGLASFDVVAAGLQQKAVQLVMETMIRPDLELFGIHFDQFFSERALHAEGRVEQALAELQQKGVASVEKLPPPRGLERDPDAPAVDVPLLVMKTSQFGDDVDRPLRKPDGTYTYFAGDVAYHWDKLQRGFDRIINVWGADHAGYVPRVRAAIQALGHEPQKFEVVLVQMVNLLRDGQPVRMGKRSGNFVTLRDVIEEAGADATRVFFIERGANAQFDFDLALAQKQEDTNPVFYVQYGHARACSILRKAAERGVAVPTPTADVLAAGLMLPEEMDLCRRMLSLTDVVAQSARGLEPHRIVFFLKDTIGAFHGYLSKYKNTEKVLSDDPVKTAARLALVEVLRLALANALDMLGVGAPVEMHRAAVAVETGVADAG